MLLLSKMLACLLCLTTLTAAAGAQEMPPQKSERLREKIESVNLIYKRTLLRQFEEYVASLKQDIESVRESRAKVDNASVAAAELDTGIERLTADLKAAEEKVAALGAEVAALTAGSGGERVAQTPAPQPGGCEAILNYDYAPAGAALVAGRFPSVAPPPGAIWCGEIGRGLDKQNPNLIVERLVERAAPILWFSPDEPLTQPRGGSKKIPEALPGDSPAERPRVYYRVSRIIDKEDGNDGFLFNTEKLALKGLTEITVRYYFYYSKDVGFEGHTNDLESLRLDIGFTPLDETGKKAEGQTPAKYYVAHIKTAAGAAHGVSWYRNQLDIGDGERDVSLPLTILVEEGKHATSPDRNADGFYSPGYDVNRGYNDAWGVRDLIGSGQLGGARYEGSMTKPRKEGGLVIPLVEAEREEQLKRYRGAHKPYLTSSRVPTYELLPVSPTLKRNVENAEIKRRAELNRLKEQGKKQGKKVDVKKEMGLDLAKLMDRENFEQVEPLNVTSHGFLWTWTKKALGIERGEEALDALTFGYRYDGQHGFTISPPVGRPTVPFIGGYVMPKLNFAASGPERRFSIEGLYTPSASRTFDWYVSVGPEWFRPLGESGYDRRFASEGGLRFRFRYKMFIGGRLGIRTTGLRRPQDPRLIFEFGPGAF